MAEIKAPKQLAVISPDGEFGHIPFEQAKDALAEGFTPATVEQTKEQVLNTAYGDNPIEAGVTGLARGVTLGVSDPILRGLGVSAERLKQVQERNPVSSTVGEMAGIVAPAAISALAGPEGPAAVLAGSTPMGLLSRAGTAAAEHIAPKVALGEGAGLTARVLSRAAPAALGSAVEGAGLGLGQSVSEEALGDHGLNAEKMMANVGLGAILGGTFGGLIEGGAEALPPAFGAAKDALTKMKNTVMGAPEEVGPLGKAYAKLSSFVSGKDEGAIIEALTNRARLATHEELEHLTDDFAKNLQDLHASVEKASKATSNFARGEETSKLLEGAQDLNPEAIKGLGQGVLRDANDLILNMRNEPELFSGNIARQIEQQRDGFMRNLEVAESPAQVHQAIDEFKRALDKKIKYQKNPPPADMAAQDALKGYRRAVKETLEDESVWGEAGARQSAYNDALSEHLEDALKPFKKDFMKKTIIRGHDVHRVDPVKVKSFLRSAGDIRGEEKNAILQKFLGTSSNLLDQIEKTYQALPEKNFSREAVDSVINKTRDVSNKAVTQSEINKTLNALGAGGHNSYLGEGMAAFTALHSPALGAAIEGFNIIRNPGLSIQRLAKIEAMANKVTQGIAKGTKAIFKGGEALAPNLVPLMTKEGIKSRENVQKNIDQISQMSRDPEHFVNHMQEQTSGMQKYAPQTADQLGVSSSLAVQFLASKLPDQGPSGVLSKKMPLSSYDLSKFQRYYSAVEDPLGVLEQVKAKTISKESVEALGAVYPKLYDEMKVQIYDEISGHVQKKGLDSISFQTKLALSLFMQEDLVTSLQTDQIAQNQLSLANAGVQQAQNQAQGQIRTSQKGLSELNKANQLTTPLQSAARREEV